jgi:hypothetical protein
MKTIEEGGGSNGGRAKAQKQLQLGYEENSRVGIPPPPPEYIPPKDLKK